MPKINTIPNYYEPLGFVFILSPQNNKIEKQIDSLNRTYHQAIKKIARSDIKSPIFNFCMKFLHEKINFDIEADKLKNLKLSEPEANKLELIKLIKKTHQENINSLNTAL